MLTDPFVFIITGSVSILLVFIGLHLILQGVRKYKHEKTRRQFLQSLETIGRNHITERFRKNLEREKRDE